MLKLFKNIPIGRVLTTAALILALFPFISYGATVTPRIEVNADPGTTVREVFKITNEERQSKIFYLTYGNFQSVDESGNPAFTGGKTDLATWISGPESVTVGPGDSREVPIAIRIPQEAEPGGHFAAIFLQTEPPNNSNPGQVAISTKLGSLVLLRVGGEFEQGGTILNFGTTNNQRFFSSLPVPFYYRFQNTGDDHLKPLGDVQITNTFGLTSKILPANPVDGSVLPKSIRRFETVWAESGGVLKQATEISLGGPEAGFFSQTAYQLKNFAFGKYTAKLKIAYGTPDLKSTNASFTFFVLPWQLMALAVPSLIILAFVLNWLVRRYNRYIIRKANKRSRK